MAAPTRRRGERAMRSSFVAANLVFALAVAAMSGPAGAADAPLAAAEKDARFFLAVCQNALDELAAVSRLAAEQNWDSSRSALSRIQTRMDRRNVADQP
ncbi:MAG TPA: hypothetical protein VNZ23_03105 [Xanthobacteraceae bacterium]|nr:hypothetical protein [Xanthobacteraceae bacterium]